MNEKTSQEQYEFGAFCHKLDNRNFRIESSGMPEIAFNGSAINARACAMAMLVEMPLGSTVRVYDHTGTIWFQSHR